ncbi:hypothetical protein ACQY0O_002417 [Thecaphora frezii]
MPPLLSRAALRSGIPPRHSGAVHNAPLHPHRLNSLAPAAKRLASTCTASPRSYHVLSKAAARIHARTYATHHATSAGRSSRSLFARIASSLGRSVAATARSTGRGGQRATVQYASLLRQVLQRALAASKLGSIRLAVEGGVGKRLAKQVSPIFRGAAQAFTGAHLRTGPLSSSSAAAVAPFQFSQRINGSSQPIVSFARASAWRGCGMGPRAPAIPRSPLHGAGLQTARNFSSDGRVFDNVVFNAPLALRLAANELDDKRSMAKPAPAVRGPRRSAAVITHKQREAQAMELGRRIAARIAFASSSPAAATVTAADPASAPAIEAVEPKIAAEAKAAPIKPGATTPSKIQPRPARLPAPPASTASSSASSGAEDYNDGDEAHYAELMLSYFDIPPWQVHTRIVMRRAEPIETMLGRPPRPARRGAALFDDSFVQDARFALEFEERRRLKIQAVLRALYEQDPLRPLSLGEDGADRYVVLVPGLRVAEAEALFRERLGFETDFVEMEELAMPDGLDLSSHAEADLTDDDGATTLDVLSEPAAGAPVDGDDIAASVSPLTTSMLLPSSRASSSLSSSVLALSSTAADHLGDDAYLYDSRDFTSSAHRPYL